MNSRRDEKCIKHDESPGHAPSAPARPEQRPPPPRRPLLIGPSSSSFRFPFTSPWAKTRSTQKAIVVVCSLKYFFPSPPLVHSRSVLLLPTPAAFLQPSPERRPVYSSIITGFLPRHCHTVFIYLVLCVYVGRYIKQLPDTVMVSLLRLSHHGNVWFY